ncbi:hypothetical protein GYMLUDRAFT_246626 [Collybiopsis luxurians FD-317 M1]|uniref:Palmitoyltransferase n=1 Tax=Collybiopsis luxurians FD-317 M1 TaxID=944289 RepID=A0A0D0B331_9AGAR|nr:hypothetical protein GYMLUDRAFT_246626 [Collybiopsis luxurians FD-317 M1]
MSSPRSLTFSFNSSTNPRRNSLTQLPLPSGMSTPSSVHSPAQPVTPNPSIIPASIANSKSRHPGSPTSSTFPVTQPFPVHTSSTHAGGVQPSASFFRPSRPRYSPPSESPSSSHMPHSEDREVFQLSDLNRNSDGTEDNSELGHGTSSGLGVPEQDSFKGPKQSRDPLLPIGENPRAGISIGREHSDSTHTTRPQHSRRPSRLRTSLDLVFNIRRGLSIDSQKSHTAASASGRHKPEPSASSDGFGSIGFSGKRRLHDEEQGYSSTHFASLRRHHSASSHISFASTRNRVRAPSFPAGYKPPRLKVAPTLSEKQYPFAVPIFTPRGQVVRRWRLHPSRNRFFLDGRILTGGDSPWAFIVTFSVLCAISGLWFGTTCQWWWFQKGVGGKVMVCIGGYLALIALSSMMKTAFTDPGILPRNLDLDPPYPTTSPSDGGVRAPMPRDLKVRADIVRVKYCPTCKTYRPPRSSHCKMCDNCVDGCDHHCQWLNNCIGRRNYTTFFALLVTGTITLFLVIATTVVHLYFLTKRGGPGTGPGPISFRQAIGSTQGAGSAAAFCLSTVVIWPVGALLSYHIRLILLNITTIEQIRNQAHKTLVSGPAPPNPFSHGTWRRNLTAVLCRPAGYSWLDATAIATDDQRKINPGTAVSANDSR